jgi:hypothetical protein
VRCPVEPEIPELYFSADLAGYGWIVRKGDWLNVGLGRQGVHGLSKHVARFVDPLQAAGRPSSRAYWRRRRSSKRAAMASGIRYRGTRQLFAHASGRPGRAEQARSRGSRTPSRSRSRGVCSATSSSLVTWYWIAGSCIGTSPCSRRREGTLPAAERGDEREGDQ